MRYLPMVCPRKNMKECGEYSRDGGSLVEVGCLWVREELLVGARSDACGCEGVACGAKESLVGAKESLVGARSDAAGAKGVACRCEGGLVVGAERATVSCASIIRACTHAFLCRERTDAAMKSICRTRRPGICRVCCDWAAALSSAYSTGRGTSSARSSRAPRNPARRSESTRLTRRSPSRVSR